MSEVKTDNFGNLSVDWLVFEKDYFADHVVGKLVIYQFFDVIHNLVYKTALLHEATGLQALLHDAAGLLVFGDLEAVSNDSVINWVFVFIFAHDV